MKKITTITVIVLVIIIAVPVILSSVIYFGNNIIAAQIVTDIESVPLPQNTQSVESTSLAGKLSGNGNGMQYIGTVLIESESSLADLKAHYAKYGFYVAEQKTQKIIQIEHYTRNFSTDVSSGNYYIVYGYGTGNDFFDLDLRGH